MENIQNCIVICGDGGKFTLFKVYSNKYLYIEMIDT